MLKKILIALGILFILIQFVRPEKNNSNNNQYHISLKHNVPPEVAAILKDACYDCHSNLTRYPWYAHIQPSAWWLANHVNEGKKHLNFSEFTQRRIAVQNHKLEEIAEMVEEKEMPLASYTYFGLHPEANLTDQQRETMAAWAHGQMAMLQVTYPADSLVLKRR